MEYEKHPIFKSYQEYVAMCLESGAEVPTITEFTESKEPFKVDENGPEFEEEWIDPAGGVHSANEADPAKQYE